MIPVMVRVDDVSDLLARNEPFGFGDHLVGARIVQRSFDDGREVLELDRSAVVRPAADQDGEVGTYLLSFSASQNQKNNRKPSPFGCLCAILTPHVAIFPQRRALMHFALRIRFRFDGRWTSLPLSDRPFAFSPQRGSPVSAKTASFL